MSAYRVKVEAHVIVEAQNVMQAKAEAETLVRLAVLTRLATWESDALNAQRGCFRFQAVGKPEKVEDAG